MMRPILQSGAMTAPGTPGPSPRRPQRRRRANAADGFFGAVAPRNGGLIPTRDVSACSPNMGQRSRRAMAACRRIWQNPDANATSTGPGTCRISGPWWLMTVYIGVEIIVSGLYSQDVGDSPGCGLVIWRDQLYSIGYSTLYFTIEYISDNNDNVV